MVSTITLPHIYADGDAYNIITSADDSFTYKDVYGICRLLEQYPLPNGVLEICSGWDMRGRAAIKHIDDEAPYYRDCDASVDLSATNPLSSKLAELTGGSQVSAVTGFSYPLNAILNKEGDAFTYSDMVDVLSDIRQVLTDDGVVAFGLHNPLPELPDTVAYECLVRVTPQYARKFDVVAKMAKLKVRVTASALDTPYEEAYVRNIEYLLSAGDTRIRFAKDLQTVTWSGPQIHNAAVEAGFRYVAFFSCTCGDDGHGYSRFTLDDASMYSERISHVLLMK